MRFSEMARALIVALAFIISVPVADAQTTNFSKYGSEEGLAATKIYCILQDRMDYIWLGTESGVSRFDGTQFENFSYDDGLAAGGVRSMDMDADGRVWFGHLNGGISLFDIDAFTRFEVDSTKLSGDVTSIRHRGTFVWISTSGNGVYRFSNPGAGEAILIGKQYAGAEGLSDQVHDTYVDSKGDLYCLADLGIRKYVELTDRFETFLPAGLTRYFAIITMYEDSKNNYWYGTYNGGLYKLNSEGKRDTVYDVRDGLASNWITSITEDYRGNIWVGTWGGGISVINGDNIKTYNSSNGLDAHDIQFILQDRENNMLISDHYVGLRIYKGDHFTTFTGESLLPNNNVWAIMQDEAGDFWFGTNKGISQFNPDRKPISPKLYKEPSYIIGDKVRFIKKDATGDLWIGTDGSGVYKFDGKTKRFIYDRTLNSLLYSDMIVKAMDIDKNGNLWIGTNDGVVKWNIKTGEGSRDTQGKGLAGNGVISVFCDSKGNTWIGSERAVGVTRYNNSTDEYQKLSLGEGFIPKSFGETPNGVIWIGTTRGLISLKGDTIERHLRVENGLLSNSVTSLLSDPDGMLYIGTPRGLNKYNPETDRISTFNEANGFIGIEARNHAAYIDSDGRLWFGTANGVTMLDPRIVPPVNTNPATHIKRMLVNYLPHRLEDGMRLNYKEKSIVFDYYSLCIDNPSAVRYMVMLDGADVTWRPVTSQTRAIYSSLAPGRYEFLVKASNSYGYWNEEPISFQFTIKPPFYFTAWFITIVSLLLIALIIAYIRMREYQLVKEKKILEEKVEERTAEVVMKSHEIEEKNRDITASIRYAERIQRAMLPPEDSFPKTFILFLPKDIVSGDFYWFHETETKRFIAAVDCTGHGVPGAFMSIIGYNSLNRIVHEEKVEDSGRVLDRLNEEVLKALLQKHEKAVNDGMDLAFVAIDKKSGLLNYAGAYNPLYIVRKGELTILKADRFPIGMAMIENRSQFASNTFQLAKGDMVYLFSDGFADQFGGPEIKKMKSVAIKNLVQMIWELPLNEQKERMERELMEWKGDNPQIDDILFIGHRIE